MLIFNKYKIRKYQKKIKNSKYSPKFFKKLIFRIKYKFNFFNLNKFEIQFFLFLYGSCILSKL